MSHLIAVRLVCSVCLIHSFHNKTIACIFLSFGSSEKWKLLIDEQRNAFAVIISSHSTDNWWTTSILISLLYHLFAKMLLHRHQWAVFRVIGRYGTCHRECARIYNIKASVELPPFAFVSFKCLKRSGEKACLLRMLWMVRGCYTMWVHWHRSGTNKVRIDFLPYSQLRIDTSSRPRACSNCALIFNTFHSPHR